MSNFLDSTVTFDQYVTAFRETLYMVGIALGIGALIGIPLGVALAFTRPAGLTRNRPVYAVLNAVVNIIRSVPFIILMVAIMPFTRLIVHTSIGTNAALVPLVVYVAPYIGRLIESAILEVDSGIYESAAAMGASTLQTIRYFILPEAKGSIVLALTTATIGLIGATAMAGTIGGGGVGDLAISYGYQQFDTIVIFITVVILVIVVQAVQSFGNWYARRSRHVAER
ncbi:methionine ABC transporter permease [Bifidobacterium tibiigranuli]|jgi:D-methionine transport system permease protein|uniref:methionine ABC transporter permease n=1 Tax=Bifidobacterium tibiigranuli TaxID=2172043 RepID=UPI0026EC5AC5|nr:methionine ABC transporter permease [Bifidobacterium tibiigranuli]MCI1649203.1 ABC transporter permease [Bifidobacterium tibiigranuli]MCI1673917.1 ABC transporter permease [Bifidobacterium tibiigranuli]MCI1712166.1 ABC transporter permease [Bifidobacterium tibiigranuli]MCI1834278.1 ABC transporter permease [Bifidobacterium tibiigranuli]MCI2185772.1 ABC transporter permease [Bifidobacterium tibiigranuli]